MQFCYSLSVINKYNIYFHGPLYMLYQPHFVHVLIEEEKRYII